MTILALREWNVGGLSCDGYLDESKKHSIHSERK